MRKLRQVGLETGELTDEEMRYIDETIVQTVYPLLIGRRVFPITKLPDAGYTSVRFYKETDMSAATISMTGETQNRDRLQNATSNVNVPVISKDFKLNWRDVIAARRRSEPLDMAHVRNASRQVAEDEDKLLITGEYAGFPALGIEGLATATGRNTKASAGAWPANAITDVNAAIAELVADGYYGPYALILNPTYYTKLLGQISNTETNYLSFIKEKSLEGRGQVLISPSLYTGAGAQTNALVVQPGADNFDAVVGQDITSYLFQDEDMNTLGKVYEVLAGRIKRAESICELTGLS